MPRRRARHDAPPPRCGYWEIARATAGGAVLPVPAANGRTMATASTCSGVDARQRETRGDGLLRQLRGAGVRAGFESLTAQLGFFDGRHQTAIAEDGRCGIAQNAADSQNDHFGFWPPCWAFSAFSILAYVSRSATVRLKTSLPSSGIRIDAEVTQPLKLIAAALHRIAQRRLQLACGQYLERVRIQIRGEVLAFVGFVGIFARE